MNKTLVFSTVFLIIIALSVAIAMWTTSLRVNTSIKTGELDWRIVPGSITYHDACGLPPGYGYFRGNDWNATYLPQPGAIQLDKDVGCTDVVLIDSDGDGDHDSLNITLRNVYPWYYSKVGFKVHNDGTIPLKIWRVIIDDQIFYELNEHVLQQGVELDLTGDGKPDVLIWWGDNFGEQLHPCRSADMGLDITVLQEAPEYSTISFTLRIEAIQWNKYGI